MSSIIIVNHFCFFTCILGLMLLIHEIQENYLPKPINSLCSMDASSGAVHFSCFKAAKPLEPILDHYYSLSTEYQSDLFVQLWKKVLREVSRSGATLTFNDVVTKIWNPVFTECCQLVDSVHAKTIKLKDVDRYFRQHKGIYLYNNLLNLFRAIEACHHRTDRDHRWIKLAIVHMEQYWSLCEHAEAANTVLHLKDSLKLRGDFDVIENVASKVTSSMKEATLESIDQKFVAAMSFLEELTRDKHKLDCLKCFAACNNIVDWLRKQTKGD